MENIEYWTHNCTKHHAFISSLNRKNINIQKMRANGSMNGNIKWNDDGNGGGVDERQQNCEKIQICEMKSGNTNATLFVANDKHFWEAFHLIYVNFFAFNCCHLHRGDLSIVCIIWMSIDPISTKSKIGLNFVSNPKIIILIYFI